jgi:hypothetical protein
MAYEEKTNVVNIEFVDVGTDDRDKEIRLEPAGIMLDAEISRWDNVSKCVARSWHQNVKRVDNSLTPAADSETPDTLRLYFRKEDTSKYHLDIVDPKDTLFVGTSGPSQNIAKDYATLSAALPDTPENDLSIIIDNVVSGRYLIGNASPVTEYLYGERL